VARRSLSTAQHPSPIFIQRKLHCFKAFLYDAKDTDVVGFTAALHKPAMSGDEIDAASVRLVIKRDNSETVVESSGVSASFTMRGSFGRLQFLT
jgi:hypothetical protein